MFKKDNVTKIEGIVTRYNFELKLYSIAIPLSINFLRYHGKTSVISDSLIGYVFHQP